MALIEERVDRLEEMMMRLVYIQQKTEMGIQELKKEMKAFKNEMLEFKDWVKKEIKRVSKQWGSSPTRWEL
ncbi:hypothetical protein [Phorcysia thermohydrogeniphila]|uniref:hypothetical protein n=1 Tax=Phorcysia thermohydrogeniphila TaxID=936138 RepID=UPI001A9CEA38|nr:hypothetical protein [Phorcysia thermohydrogeniphila]